MYLQILSTLVRIEERKLEKRCKQSRHKTGGCGETGAAHLCLPREHIIRMVSVLNFILYYISYLLTRSLASAAAFSSKLIGGGGSGTASFPFRLPFLAVVEFVSQEL